MIKVIIVIIFVFGIQYSKNDYIAIVSSPYYVYCYDAVMVTETFTDKTETKTKSQVRFIEIAAEQHGQRIDNFLLRTLKGVPKSKVYNILRKGEVRVNRGRIKPDYRLQTGDTVRIPPVRVSATTIAKPPQSILQQLADSVLYESDDVLIIDKPAGLAVHKGSGLDFGVIEALRVLRPDAPFLELVHRLDRETSGCLLLAKTPTALRQLNQVLKNGEVDKRYLTLVRGQWDYGEHQVNVPLRKNAVRGGERVVIVSEDGKSALSHFKPISLTGQTSLLEVTIATGRTHQIRVHAAYAGHPVAGDDKYGDAEFNQILSRVGLDRLFLHAHSLVLSLGGKEIAVNSPLGDELRRVLEKLSVH